MTGRTEAHSEPVEGAGRDFVADLPGEPASSTSGRSQRVCPRCSNGRPICTDTKPDGSPYAHADTCATYEWADDVCGRCQAEASGGAS